MTTASKPPPPTETIPQHDLTRTESGLRGREPALRGQEPGRPAQPRGVDALDRAAGTAMPPRSIRFLRSPAGGAVVLAGGSVLLVAVLCGVFLLAGVPVPPAAVLAGRWIPALLSLALLFLLWRSGGGERLGASVARSWRLRPGGQRPLLRAVGTSAAAMATLTGVYLLSLLLSDTLGAVTAQPLTVLLPALLLSLPLAVVLAVSVAGEEVVWRGHLPRLLEPLGFWGSSLVVAVAWVLFHVPLHAVYVLEGSLDLAVAAAVTAALIPLSLFLSAVAARWGSVWPAVWAHALPFTALNLAAGGSAPSTEAMWAVTGITAVLLTSVTLVLAPVEPSRSAGGEPV